MMIPSGAEGAHVHVAFVCGYTVRKWQEDVAKLSPMLALLAESPLQGASLIFEPKYDGIRALVDVNVRGHAASARIWSRAGNDKTHQFPEVAQALSTLGVRVGRSLALDGEIVAVGGDGAKGFETLQPRLQLTRAHNIRRNVTAVPVAFVAFDILRDGSDDLRELPLSERRRRLESVMADHESPDLRLGRSVPTDGRGLMAEAVANGWEGLIVKEAQSHYHAGRRGPAWRKLKIVHRQEFVLGGWTEPRGSRDRFGALLLGVYDGGHLVYAGHVGTGFDQRTLVDLAGRLAPLETPHCPFAARPDANGKAHWVRPNLVAEVKFAEWTSAGILRHPVFLGLRDDVAVRKVKRETQRPVTATIRGDEPATPVAAHRPLPPVGDSDELLARLDEIERSGAGGRLKLSGGVALDVANLDKVYWPRLGITKGELMRHYARVAPYILPVVDGRPLVMKRYPDGIEGEAFYQQRAPQVPAGIRIVTLANDHEVPSRLVGGDLATLLYMVQLGVISQDPWFSRVDSPEFPDEVALDLDPMPDVPFTRVLEVARWLHEALERIGVAGFPKTSGASGLHIHVPLVPGTPYEAARLFAQIIGTAVARAHPKAATVERAVSNRGSTVYIDCLQNVRGKTLACAYSARASDFAGTSTPLTWQEVHDEPGINARDFTIRSLPGRLATTGDLWAGTRARTRVNLHVALAALERDLPGPRPSPEPRPSQQQRQLRRNPRQGNPRQGTNSKPGKKM